MQFLLDYLTSILVGSVVLVILLVSQTTTKQKDIDAQLYAVARRQTLAFDLILEKDLRHVGYKVNPNENPITEVTDSSFAFRRAMNTTSTAPVVTVRYARRLRHTITAPDGTPTPVYAIVRTEDGAPAGGTTATVTDYRLEMLRQNGTVTPDPKDNVVGLRVSFASVYGDRARDLENNRSRYSRTFYPAALSPK